MTLEFDINKYPSLSGLMAAPARMPAKFIDHIVFHTFIAMFHQTYKKLSYLACIKPDLHLSHIYSQNLELYTYLLVV